MAKNNRFPSDANKKKAQAAAKAEEQSAEGVKQDLVQVEYKKDNHHVLQGVHALRKGVNSVPKDVWVEAKKHPSIAQMIEAGHIVDPMDGEEEEAPAEEQAGDEEGEESSEDGEAKVGA